MRSPEIPLVTVHLVGHSLRPPRGLMLQRTSQMCIQALSQSRGPTGSMQQGSAGQAVRLQQPIQRG